MNVPRQNTEVRTPLFLLSLFVVIPIAHAQRERIRLDDDWRFKYEAGPTGIATIKDWEWRPSQLKPGQETGFDDLAKEPSAAWQHARPVEDTFHGRQGFNWYRAHLPGRLIQTPTLSIDFVDDNATFFLNGQQVFRQVGYGVPLEIDLSKAWKTQGVNELTILVENTGGAGGVAGAVLHDIEPKKAPSEASVTTSDKSWAVVQVPHDFVVTQKFSKEADGGHGFLPSGLGWYRKTLSISNADRGKRLWLDFDGVFRNSTVWVNGQIAGHHLSGYAPFRYDITDYLHYGASNLIAVKVDARKPEGWWYEGGGIYRHVWLNKANPVHIVPDGLFVHCDQGAMGVEVTASVELTNQSAMTTRVTARPTILDANGTKVIAKNISSILAAGETRTVQTKFNLGNKAHLWSLEDPYRYSLSCSVDTGGRHVDSQNTKFGVRFLRFDPEKGFFLNGKALKIKGTCDHQDFAAVGTAISARVFEWRVKKLKQMGSNAYRCSHNMVAEELLEACDRLGMLVMDENRHLGASETGKTPSGTPLGDLADLKTMVRRDRNHPSVFMWSMCNEEGLQGSAEGAALFKGMRDAVIKIDPTRPVTSAMNGGWGSGFTFVEDIQGINYSPGAYDGFHKQFPNKVLMGSETASEVGTRGEYVNDPVKGYVSAYGRNAPPWAQPAELAWKMIADREFVFGGFVWTGFDYRGEPTPYSWPCVNSHFGIMDMCGFPKDTYYYYKAWWTDKPSVHVFPHWNWPASKIGKPIEVWVQTNADSVELFLNGKSLGSKPGVRLGHVEFSVPYQPGTLEARGKFGGTVVTDKVVTTGPPAKIKLVPYWTKIKPEREDQVLVEVQVLDRMGRLVPTAENRIQFSTTGSARIVGTGNGDPSDHELNQSPSRRVFHGLEMVVLQSGARPGHIILKAQSPGLKADSVELQVSN